MSQITEEQLQELHWNDFSILEHQEDQVLVLVYEDPLKAQKFLTLLHENEFEIRFLTEANTDRHIIEITFKESEYTIRTVFNKTETSYPIKSRIQTGIKYLSTGIVDKQHRDGKRVLYDQRLKIIDQNLFLN